MSGEPVKKCLMCGKENPAHGPWHWIRDGGRYSLIRDKLCFECVRDFEYAETFLLFHEIAEVYPDSPK